MFDETSLINSIVTLCCSYLSLVGSVLVLLSYVIARRKSTPKAAYLILHLAASDFLWFFASAIQSTYWMVGDGSVPTNVCYVCGPTVIFTRMASLLWTCAISFNVLMSVEKRKWSWKSQEKSWEWYKHRYYFIIFVFSFPGALLSVIKQHSSSGNSNLGCDPGYEKLGLWYEVFFIEVFPIVLGFSCNLYVYFQIRNKMSQSAFPQSVRKRRKRIMYHYIIVCILCWIPTIIFYFVELIGFHVPALEIVGRTSLYISGFLNFLVFGMQDPHLKRSFVLVLHWMGLSYIIPRTAYYRGPLKTSDVEKTVMFEEATISRNADLSKDKKNIYRYHKLSRDDKKALYAERPDLDPKHIVAIVGSGALTAAAIAASGGKGGKSGRSQDGGTYSSSGEDSDGGGGKSRSSRRSNSSKHSLSVLSDIGVIDALSSGSSPLHPRSPGGEGAAVDQSLVLEEGGGVLQSSTPSSSGLRKDRSTASGGDDSLLVPRDSTELTVAGNDRNSLGLNLIGSNSLPTGVATGGSGTQGESHRVRSPMLAPQTCDAAYSDTSGGFSNASRLDSGDKASGCYGDDEGDESSEDESDEEDMELKAPVGGRTSGGGAESPLLGGD